MSLERECSVEVCPEGCVLLCDFLGTELCPGCNVMVYLRVLVNSKVKKGQKENIHTTLYIVIHTSQIKSRIEYLRITDNILILLLDSNLRETSSHIDGFPTRFNKNPEVSGLLSWATL